MNPKRTDALPWRTIDERTVVIHPKKGEVHEFNEVASMIWLLADGSHSLDDIAAKIAHDFDVEPAQAAIDVATFLDELLQSELCQRS